MSKRIRQGGFSLAETLIALGVLTVGMLFVAGVFPVGIHFTYVAIDRTISAAVADEAFARVRLYAQRAFDDANDSYDKVNIKGLETENLRDFNDWFNWYVDRPGFDDYEMHYEDFAYPSVANVNEVDKRYCWSALCRITGEGDPNDTERMVQVTVFVSKRMGPVEKYYIPNWSNWSGNSYGTVSSSLGLSRWPMPVKVDVSESNVENNELRITGDKRLINDGYWIVAEWNKDDEGKKTGQIFRVLERYPDDDDDIILLDKDRPDDPGEAIDYVWVIPPAETGGKSPCVAIYQKNLRF